MRTIRALYLPLLSAAGLSLMSASALAQTTASPAQDGQFSVQRFEPAPGTKNFLSVEGLRMDGHWGWSVGLAFDYAKNPFVVLACKPTAASAGRVAPATCDDAKVTSK